MARNRMQEASETEPEEVVDEIIDEPAPEETPEAPAPEEIPEELPEEPVEEVEESVSDEHPTLPRMADLKGVRYVGQADRKILTSEDLNGVGIENPKSDLEFSADNGFFIVASEINAATRNWFATQTDFVVE